MFKIKKGKRTIRLSIAGRAVASHRKCTCSRNQEALASHKPCSRMSKNNVTVTENAGERPLRDRRSRFLFGGVSAVTCEPLKVRRHVKHCKKKFSRYLSDEPNKVTLHLKVLRKTFLIFVRFGQVFDHFQDNILSRTF